MRRWFPVSRPLIDARTKEQTPHLCFLAIVWYFVLYGGTQRMVREVHQMHPPAIEELLIDDVREGTIVGTGKKIFHKMHFTLLDAACRATNIHDDVILFVARTSPPVALITQFNNGDLPYVTRLFRKPNSGQASLASLELIDALVPKIKWKMNIFCSLLNAGYSPEILHHFLDKISDKAKKNDSWVYLLPTSGGARGEGVLVDTGRAHVLERVMPFFRAFRCKPSRWTLDGFRHTCLAFSWCSSLKELELAIDLSMIVDNDGSVEDVTVSLESLFSRNSSIDLLRLSATKCYLEAIVKGLSLGRDDRRLTLVLEKSTDPETIDITGSLQCLLQKGLLKRLSIAPSAKYKFEVSQQDESLSVLEFDADLDNDDLDELIEVLKNNTTLQHVVAYKSTAKVDYSGFTKKTSVPNENIKPLCPVWCKSIYDEKRAEQISYYTRLNGFGRKKARDANTTPDEFVRLLDSVQQRLPIDELDYCNVIFGLLLESSPSLWQP